MEGGQKDDFLKFFLLEFVNTAKKGRHLIRNVKETEKEMFLGVLLFCFFKTKLC